MYLTVMCYTCSYTHACHVYHDIVNISSYGASHIIYIHNTNLCWLDWLNYAIEDIVILMWTFIMCIINTYCDTFGGVSCEIAWSRVVHVTKCTIQIICFTLWLHTNPSIIINGLRTTIKQISYKIRIRTIYYNSYRILPIRARII